MLAPARPGNARLTADDVREARRLRGEGVKVRSIAERFGVGKATITRATREEN
jgi:transposase